MTKNILSKQHYIIFAIVILYIFAILKYSINMPYWDDYDAVLGFLNTYVQQNNILDKLKLLLSQHNEHRILFNRLVELAQYKLIGEVNFLYLILVGNAGWLSLVYLLYIYYKKYSLDILKFTPVVFLMLSFSHWNIMEWAMASLQQYWQLYFSILSIYFLVNFRYTCAYFFMICAIFTGGGGIALIPIFFLFFITRKDIKNIIFLLIFSCIILFVYFGLLGYTKPGSHPSMLSALKHPLNLIEYSLTFLGNVWKNKTISIVLGIFTVSLFLFLSKKIFRKNSFLFWSILFVLETSAILAISRSGFGVEQALASRYTIYSVLALSLIYIAFILNFKPKIAYNLGMFFGIVSFFAWFYYGTQNMEFYKLFHQNQIFYPNLVKAEKILNQSASLSIYNVWKPTPTPNMIYRLQKEASVNRSGLDITIPSGKKYDLNKNPIIYLNKDISKILISGWSIDFTNKNAPCGIYICIDNKCSQQLLVPRHDVAKYYKDNRYLRSGIRNNLDISNLSLGNHFLTVKTLNSQCSAYYETKKIQLIKNEF